MVKLIRSNPIFNPVRALVLLVDPAADSQVAGLAHDTNNNRIYITAYTANMVVRINPETNEFDGTPIPVGVNPFGVAYNPKITISKSLIMVRTLYPTNSVIDTIPTGTNPAGIAYNPSNNHIYVANAGSNTVSIIHP